MVLKQKMLNITCTNQSRKNIFHRGGEHPVEFVGDPVGLHVALSHLGHQMSNTHIAGMLVALNKHAQFIGNTELITDDKKKRPFWWKSVQITLKLADQAFQKQRCNLTMTHLQFWQIIM